MMTASFGMAALAPTASIRPLRSTVLPVGVSGPATGTILAPRIAYGVTAGSCALEAAMVRTSVTAAMTVLFMVASSLLPAHETLPEQPVLVLEADVAPVDDHVLDVRRDLERIAVDDEKVGDLAFLEAANRRADAENLGGVDRQRLDRLVLRQPPRHRLSGLVRQQPRRVVAAGRKRELHARLLQYVARRV